MQFYGFYSLTHDSKILAMFLEFPKLLLKFFDLLNIRLNICEEILSDLSYLFQYGIIHIHYCRQQLRMNVRSQIKVQCFYSESPRFVQVVLTNVEDSCVEQTNMFLSATVHPQLQVTLTMFASLSGQFILTDDHSIFPVDTLSDVKKAVFLCWCLSRGTYLCTINLDLIAIIKYHGFFKDTLKRRCVGIWHCKGCNKTLAGGAWVVR